MLSWGGGQKGVPLPNVRGQRRSLLAIRDLAPPVSVRFLLPEARKALHKRSGSVLRPGLATGLHGNFVFVRNHVRLQNRVRRKILGPIL
jgi:hypothetical protein